MPRHQILQIEVIARDTTGRELSRTRREKVEGTTAAEYEFLRVLHGPDNVVAIGHLGWEDRPDIEELQRLHAKYRADAPKRVLTQVYPPMMRKLPHTSVDAPLTAEDEAAPEPEFFTPAPAPAPAAIPQSKRHASIEVLKAKFVERDLPLPPGRPNVARLTAALAEADAEEAKENADADAD